MNLWSYFNRCNSLSGTVSACVSPVSFDDLRREDSEFAVYMCHKHCRGSHAVGYGRLVCAECGVPLDELVARVKPRL